MRQMTFEYPFEDDCGFDDYVCTALSQHLEEFCKDKEHAKIKKMTCCWDCALMCCWDGGRMGVGWGVLPLLIHGHVQDKLYLGC